MEQEVEASLVLSRRLKIRNIQGKLTPCELTVYECEEPFVLIFNINTEKDDSARLDVLKDDLARELRRWLEGHIVQNPAVVIAGRIGDAITEFVRLGKTPKQEDLILWILSRCEYGINFSSSDRSYNSKSSRPVELIFGGRGASASASALGGGVQLENSTESAGHASAVGSTLVSSSQQYPRTVAAALESGYFSRADEELLANSDKNRDIFISGGNPQSPQQTDLNSSTRTRPKSASYAGRSPGNGPGFGSGAGESSAMSEDLGMYSMTRQLLGSSQALNMLKRSRRPSSSNSNNNNNNNNRSGAAASVSFSQLKNSEQHQLYSDITKARKAVERAMDERRRCIEVTKTRKEQRFGKLQTIRAELHEAKSGDAFTRTARGELSQLLQIEQEIRDDINRQRVKAVREVRQVAILKAPPGYQNLRGSWQRGPTLGMGPLPFRATGSLPDPRVQAAARRFYWDSAGRRHEKDGVEDAVVSMVDKAMEAIRKAAANISLYKLDLKTVFEQFDASGDGFLSRDEMREAFESMGVLLDDESMHAIYNHFDPNESGSVHFGEFVWAFYNRRGFVRQWKRKVDGLTPGQVRARFHAADTNGNGRLNVREFRKLLRSFGMEVSEADVQILIDRFDVDGDGDVDLDEFRTFIESEQKTLFSSPSLSTSFSTSSCPSSAVIESDQQQPQQQGRGTARMSSSSRQQGSKMKVLLLRAENPPRGLPLQRQQQEGQPADAISSQDVNIPSYEQLLQLSLQHHDGDAKNQREMGEVGEDREGREEGRGEKVQEKVQEKAVLPKHQNKDSNELWMTRMLQAQAEVEGKLGNRYYNYDNKGRARTIT